MNSKYDIPHNYRVLRKATRSVRIKIQNDLTVHITVPFIFSDKRVFEIIEKKKKWIDRHLETFASRKRVFTIKDNEILLFGKLFEFIHRPELRRKVNVDRSLGRVESGVNIPAEASSKHSFYKKLAAEYITEKAERTAEEHGFSFNRIFIRSQKTKWGTCSSKKNISFNWRLVICPEFVIDYLIIHELVHTEIMNHSKQYWERVGELFPDYKKAKKWLDDNSYAVHRI